MVRFISSSLGYNGRLSGTIMLRLPVYFGVPEWIELLFRGVWPSLFSGAHTLKRSETSSYRKSSETCVTLTSQRHQNHQHPAAVQYNTSAKHQTLRWTTTMNSRGFFCIEHTWLYRTGSSSLWGPSWWWWVILNFSKYVQFWPPGKI